MDPEENCSSIKGNELAWERLAQNSEEASQKKKSCAMKQEKDKDFLLHILRLLHVSYLGFC